MKELTLEINNGIVRTITSAKNSMMKTKIREEILADKISLLLTRQLMLIEELKY